VGQLDLDQEIPALLGYSHRHYQEIGQMGPYIGQTALASLVAMLASPTKKPLLASLNNLASSLYFEDQF
jgi:hypothetical protein